MSGSQILNAVEEQKLCSGLTYVNIHSADERMYRDKAGRRSRSTGRRAALELKAV
jgi:hypothetical protein